MPGAVERGGDAGRLLGHEHGEVRDVVRAVAGDEAVGLGRERLGVAADDAAARGVPLVEVPEAHAQHGRLELVEPRVAAARERHLVLAAPAVLAQPAHALGDLVARGGDRAAVAERGEVLGRVEAERGRVAERAGAAAVAARAGGLGAVLDQRDPALAAEHGDRLDLGDEAVEMRRDDGLRLGGERRLERRGREAERHRVDVGEAHAQAELACGRRRVAAAVRRDDDLVAGLAADAEQRQLERVRAARDAEAVADAEERGELVLERVVLRAHDVAARREHAVEHARAARRASATTPRPGSLTGIRFTAVIMRLPTVKRNSISSKPPTQLHQIREHSSGEAFASALNARPAADAARKARFPSTVFFRYGCANQRRRMSSSASSTPW